MSLELLNEIESDEEVAHLEEEKELDIDNDDLLLVDAPIPGQAFCSMAVFDPDSRIKMSWEKLCFIEYARLKLQNNFLTEDEICKIANEELDEDLVKKQSFLKEIYSKYFNYTKFDVDNPLSSDSNNYNNYSLDNETLKELYPDEWFESLIKVRGTFNSLRSADQYAEKVTNKTDENIAAVLHPVNGAWYYSNPDPSVLEYQRTPNKNYNELIKGKYDNKKELEAKRRELEQKSKLKNKLKKSANKRKVNKKKGN